MYNIFLSYPGSLSGCTTRNGGTSMERECALKQIYQKYINKKPAFPEFLIVVLTRMTILFTENQPQNMEKKLTEQAGKRCVSLMKFEPVGALGIACLRKVRSVIFLTHTQSTAGRGAPGPRKSQEQPVRKNAHRCSLISTKKRFTVGGPARSGRTRRDRG